MYLLLSLPLCVRRITKCIFNFFFCFSLVFRVFSHSPQYAPSSSANISYMRVFFFFLFLLLLFLSNFYPNFSFFPFLTVLLLLLFFPMCVDNIFFVSLIPVESNRPDSFRCVLRYFVVVDDATASKAHIIRDMKVFKLGILCVNSIYAFFSLFHSLWLVCSKHVCFWCDACVVCDTHIVLCLLFAALCHRHYVHRACLFSQTQSKNKWDNAP